MTKFIRRGSYALELDQWFRFGCILYLWEIRKMTACDYYTVVEKLSKKNPSTRTKETLLGMIDRS